MNKKLIFILLLSFLFVVYIYTTNITLIPQSIILIQGENLNLSTLWGINIVEKNSTNPNLDRIAQGKIIQTSGDVEKENGKSVENINLTFNIFDNIPLKEVAVNVIPKTKVVPLGNAIGLKLYTEGVLIVGMSEIEGQKPYENLNIKEGDRIIAINNEEIIGAEDLIEAVNQTKGKEIFIKYMRQDKELETSIIPAKTKDNEYKLGLWVRDAAAGVGTATFYIPETGTFAALGHGITDADTGELVTISNGELVTTNIVSIQKGARGKPRRNKRNYRRRK